MEVEDWEVYYHFGIAPKILNDIIRGAYWETSRLTLYGNILSPTLKNAMEARVDLVAEPEKEDHWAPNPTVLSSKAIGFMEIPKGKKVLQFYCSIPPRLSYNIHRVIIKSCV
jgi:hypothetical protein